jgi:hypothetical protein
LCLNHIPKKGKGKLFLAKRTNLLGTNVFQIVFYRITIT